MKEGRISFTDILGEQGMKYDMWLNNQIAGYYLTYKQNFYSDVYDFSIEQEGCGASEPVILAKRIDVITRLIDQDLAGNKLSKEINKKKIHRER